MENSAKNISTINPAITENMECSIVEARAPHLKVGDLLLHFILLSANVGQHSMQIIT